MRVVLSGSRSFGAAVYGLLQEQHHDIVLISSPEVSDGKLDALKQASYDVMVPWVAPRDLVPDTIPRGTDIIVCAHSHAILTDAVLARAKFGAMGYHPSLLPRHRGRDAIPWTIQMRDPVAGGTVYWLDEVIDGGPIAAQDWCFVDPSWRAGDLWREALFPMGIRLLRKVLQDVSEGVVIARVQDERFATYEPPFISAKTMAVVPPKIVHGPKPEPEPVAFERDLTLEQIRPMTWQLLDAILRRWQEFRSLLESEGLEEMYVRGHLVNVHDMLSGIDSLPPRQREAIYYTCLQDMREIDAATIMLPGSKSAAPVGTYKRKGLKTLAKKMWNVDLEIPSEDEEAFDEDAVPVE